MFRAMLQENLLMSEVFIIVGIVVNCGGNVNNAYIGGKYWTIGDAPFVDGIGGFASVFVTASFALCVNGFVFEYS